MMNMESRAACRIAAVLLVSAGCDSGLTYPSPRPPETFDGTVSLADTREPVVGALILIDEDLSCEGCWGREWNTRGVRRTDAGGRYRIDLRVKKCWRDVRIRVEPSESDLRADTVQFGPCQGIMTHDFLLEYKQPVELAVEGVVRSRTSGLPIPGAQVELQRNGGNFWDFGRDPLAVAVAGASGEYRLDVHVDDCSEDFRRGMYVVAGAAGFFGGGEKPLHCTSETQIFDFTLSPER